MTEKKEKRRKKLIVEHRNGYVLIYPEERKPPTKGNPLRPIDYFLGATLQNGELVNSKKGVKEHGKKKNKKV